MQRVAIFLLCAALAMITPAQASDNSNYTIATDKIVAATQFLEEHPLDPGAPVLRAAMIKWEDKAKEVVDYVCPDVLKPIPSDSIPYSAELLVQFIFGSAAHQLAHPADKGVLIPSQLAGMRSMLKAYAGFLAADPKARVPRLDELTRMEAEASLTGTSHPSFCVPARPDRKCELLHLTTHSSGRRSTACALANVAAPAPLNSGVRHQWKVACQHNLCLSLKETSMLAAGQRTATRVSMYSTVPPLQQSPAKEGALVFVWSDDNPGEIFGFVAALQHVTLGAFTGWRAQPVPNTFYRGPKPAHLTNGVGA